MYLTDMHGNIASGDQSLADTFSIDSQGRIQKLSTNFIWEYYSTNDDFPHQGVDVVLATNPPDQNHSSLVCLLAPMTWTITCSGGSRTVLAIENGSGGPLLRLYNSAADAATVHAVAVVLQAVFS
jgi:hypothetical protein